MNFIGIRCLEDLSRGTQLDIIVDFSVEVEVDVSSGGHGGNERVERIVVLDGETGMIAVLNAVVVVMSLQTDIDVLVDAIESVGVHTAEKAPASLEREMAELEA